jgi:8-oxo-dGTP pyrophosphatase MutT (NUDIX family)
MPRLEFAQKAVVVDDEDQVLMLRKSGEDPYFPGRWDLPGGRMKDSEDVDTHLIREVLEETGLHVSPVGAPIHLWSWVMEWHGEPVSVVAVSRYCRLRPPRPASPTRELDDYLCEQRWFPRQALLDLDVIPSQRPTIQRVVQQATSVVVP